MVCGEFKKLDFFELYLGRRLEGPDEAAFERHFLACDSCHGELKLLTELRDELRQLPQTGSFRWLRPRLTAAVTGLILMMTLAAWLSLRPDSLQRRLLHALAHVEAPDFTVAAVRGDRMGEAGALLQDAMQHYRDAQYPEAIHLLERSRSMNPFSPEPGFYLGVTCLLAGRPGQARDALTLVIGQGETVFLERAYFFRAKAHLQLGAVPSARRDLQAIVDTGDALRSRAGSLLRQLEAL